MKFKITFQQKTKASRYIESASMKDAIETLVSFDANLFGANLRGANLFGANLRGANLFGANLRGANLEDTNLFGANLRGANLFGANLEGANLEDTDLRGADLFGANLERANLRGANLQDTDLRGADLEDANLLGANLFGADLRGANLFGANLEGANLEDANLEDHILTIGRIGSRKGHTFYNVSKGQVLWGHFKGTVEEFRNSMQATYPDETSRYRKEYEAVLIFMAAIKEANCGHNESRGVEDEVQSKVQDY